MTRCIQIKITRSCAMVGSEYTCGWFFVGGGFAFVCFHFSFKNQAQDDSLWLKLYSSASQRSPQWSGEKSLLCKYLFFLVAIPACIPLCGQIHRDISWLCHSKCQKSTMKFYFLFCILKVRLLTLKIQTISTDYLSHGCDQNTSQKQVKGQRVTG